MVAQIRGSFVSFLLLGVVCSSAAFIQELMDLKVGTLMLLGATMNPTVAAQVRQKTPKAFVC